jgi:hypothetical protein
MSEANTAFVEMAQPHSWFLVADGLHGQAVELRTAFGRGQLSRIDPLGQSTSTWDVTNRATFLLGGFALENLLKAFLVYENPHWISNGRLGRPLRSHCLTRLAADSRLVPYKRRAARVLRAFEHGLESWARYPCGLSADDPGDERILDDRLWKSYLQVVGAYGRSLRKLLSTSWKGPHGFEARYRITGEFFGVTG